MNDISQLNITAQEYYCIRSFTWRYAGSHWVGDI